MVPEGRPRQCPGRTPGHRQEITRALRGYFKGKTPRIQRSRDEAPLQAQGRASPFAPGGPYPGYDERPGPVRLDPSYYESLIGTSMNAPRSERCRGAAHLRPLQGAVRDRPDPIMDRAPTNASREGWLMTAHPFGGGRRNLSHAGSSRKGQLNSRIQRYPAPSAPAVPHSPPPVFIMYPVSTG